MPGHVVIYNIQNSPLSEQELYQVLIYTYIMVYYRHLKIFPASIILLEDICNSQFYFKCNIKWIEHLTQ